MRNFECKYARERCLEMRIHVLFCNVTREKNSWGDLSWTVITFHEIQDDLNCVMHNLAVLGPRKLYAITSTHVSLRWLSTSSNSSRGNNLSKSLHSPDAPYR